MSCGEAGLGGVAGECDGEHEVAAGAAVVAGCGVASWGEHCQVVRNSGGDGIELLEAGLGQEGVEVAGGHLRCDLRQEQFLQVRAAVGDRQFTAGRDVGRAGEGAAAVHDDVPGFRRVGVDLVAGDAQRGDGSGGEGVAGGVCEVVGASVQA